MAAVAQPLGQASPQVWVASRAAGPVRRCRHAGVWQVRWLLAVVERVLGILELAEEVAGIDTGLEELVAEVARTDTGSEELVGEAGLTHTCHRTARNRQAVDHTTCTTSSSRLFETRPGPNLLCFCSYHAVLPCAHQS